MNPWIMLILGLIIGWAIELLIDVFYWRKRRLCPEDDVLHIQAELDKALAANGRLEADLNGRNAKIAELEDQLANSAVVATNGNQASDDVRIADLEAQLDLCQSSLAEMRSRDAEYMGPRGLSMVWGLNSDANDKLEEKGIYTYSQLGATNATDIDDALTHSQKYYPDKNTTEIHGSWVEQSRFAAGGDWDGLFGYQQSNFPVASLKEDLKKMWGIGPKVEEVLNDKGIFLWSQLASVPADRITDILREAGSRFRMSSDKLHESWPEQARLADQGKWDELKELTDKLSWSNVN